MGLIEKFIRSILQALEENGLIKIIKDEGTGWYREWVVEIDGKRWGISIGSEE